MPEATAPFEDDQMRTMTSRPPFCNYVMSRTAVLVQLDASLNGFNPKRSVTVNTPYLGTISELPEEHQPS